MRGTRGKLKGFVGSLAVATLLPLSSAPPAMASVAPEQPDNGDGEVALTDLQFQMPADEGARAGVWLWHGGRRLYTVAGRAYKAASGVTSPTYARDTTTSNFSRNAWTRVVSYDLDTGAAVATSPTLHPPGYAREALPRNEAVVDQDGGRLFVPYEGNTAGAVFLEGTRLCVQTQPPCLGGFHVLEAESLDPVRRIPLELLTVDGSSQTSPTILDTAFAPREGTEGKLLALLREHQWGDAQADKASTAVYAVQFDVGSGRQEWAIRMDACRGKRPDGGLDASMHQKVADVGLIYQSPDPGDGGIYAVCHGQAATAMINRIPLDDSGYPSLLPAGPGDAASAVTRRVEGDTAPPQQSDFVASNATVQSIVGPQRAGKILVDPEGGRIVIAVYDGKPVAEVWWIFDVPRRSFLGTVGIGNWKYNESVAALDSETGQLYVGGPTTVDMPRGGVFLTNVRRTVLQQALYFPEPEPHFATYAQPPASGNFFPLEVDPARDGRPARLLFRGGDGTTVSNNRNYVVFEDRTVTAESPISDAPTAPRSLDLEEVDGVTQSVFDGAARGYGARVMLIGGAMAATRVGSGDASIAWRIADQQVNGQQFVPAAPRDMTPYHCPGVDRSLILGMTGLDGPAVVDAAGSRGGAEPLIVDSGTHADFSNPVSRCAPRDWENVWTAALFGRPPAEEPGVSLASEGGSTQCVSSEEGSDRSGDPVTSPFAASVECADEEASGWSQARAVGLDGLSIAEAVSSYRIYRDPTRGMVARVESVARGIALGGMATLNSVRGVAESWANGRRQPVAEAEREPGYDPNCDHERTAGTCYVRSISGVRTPAYSCGPCGNEDALIDGLNKALGAYGRARLRNPDEELRRGSSDGSSAAVQKPDHERFADLVFNNDTLQTVLPALEFVREANQGNAESNTGMGKGRQIYQFAGVEVSSSYAIQCLLVYDEAANTCAEPAEAPGSIQVSLSDTDGEPLAGGAFEVRADVDADGVLGLKDSLLPDGACVTADDGVGTCVFENLAPGTYLVSQVAAPPGYAKTAEPWVSQVASGERRTVAFTNVSNVSTIDLTATDENGAPLSGAVFAAYPDADSDGKVAPDAQPAAECTTDTQGVCQMKVPAGSYVLVQTSAPGGLEGIEPVPFTFASGGQVASVSVVNYPPESPQAPEGAASPVYTPPVDMAPPREFVEDGYVPEPAADTPVIEEPAVSVPERIGGTVTQVIRAPGDALRLLARDPKQAVAWTAALALFVLAAMAVRRRQQAIALIQG